MLPRTQFLKVRVCNVDSVSMERLFYTRNWCFSYPSNDGALAEYDVFSSGVAATSAVVFI